MRLREWSLNAAVLCCTISALFVAGLTARRELRPGPPAARDEKISPSEWSALLSTGHRVGPTNAVLAVVEFGDFECPACGAFYRMTRRFSELHPGEFAIVFHHLPIEYHEFANDYAVASECAADQGAFETYYDSVFAHQRQIGKRSLVELAAAAGARDTVSFRRCLSKGNKSVIVEADAQAAARVHATATPTLVVDGVRLGRGIDSAGLEDLLRRARSKVGH